MMEKEEVFRVVSRYLVKDFEVPAEKIRPEANLFTDLGMDSIDALDWFAKMETTIKLPIVEEDIKRVRTVQDVVSYVMRHLKRNA
ncbi:MAG TPA: acyl carrier protein [Desulfatiglandales bacterium]